MKKLSLAMVLFSFTITIAAEESSTEDMIKEALSAAHPELAAGASVMDWKGNVLRGGYNDWICYPTPPGGGAAKCPMCLDKTWRDLVAARGAGEDFKPQTVGIGYMLAGDCPVSNTDPSATAPTKDNQWINAEGPHLMLILPAGAGHEGVPTDPYSGKPYVMWKDSPYVHIMVPTAGN